MNVAVEIDIAGKSEELEMSGISANQLDKMILSHVSLNWKKTAFILAKTLHAFEDQGTEISENEIFARIQSLHLAGKLAAQGNLSDWRHSEVKLLL